MKRTVYALLLIAGFAQIAANTEIISAAQLPKPVEQVCTAMIRPALETLEGIITEREAIIGWVSLRKVNQPFLETSVGKILSTLSSEGFNVTLSANPKVAAQANTYFNRALQSVPVQNALSLADSENDNMQQALHYWAAFDHHMHTSIAKAMNGEFPDIALMKTPLETIVENAKKPIFNPDYGCIYDLLPNEQEAFMAAQLALGFSLRLQLEKNPAVFTERFAQFLQAAEPTEQSTPACSSKPTRFASSLEFWKQIECNNAVKEQTKPVVEQRAVAESSNTQSPIVPQRLSSITVDPEAFGITLWNAGIISL